MTAALAAAIAGSAAGDVRVTDSVNAGAGRVRKHGRDTRRAARAVIAGIS